MANVEKTREYRDSSGAVILTVENGADAKNVDIDPIEGVEALTAQGAIEELNDRLSDVEQGGGSGDTPSSDAASVGYSNSNSGLSSTNVQGAIDELAANAAHELSASVLSPVQVWNDDFSVDRTVSLYVEPYVNQTGTYTHRTKSTPVSLSAYQIHGTSINRDNIFSAYVPFTKSGDKLVLQQCYTADMRETVWQVELVDAAASVKIGFFVFTFNDGNGNSTQVGSNPNANSSTGSFTVDFGNLLVTSGSSSYAITLSPAIGKRYFIKFTTVDRSSYLTITNANDNTEKQTILIDRDLRCSPYIEWVAGSFNVRKLTVTVYGGACDYYITGDSIVFNALSQVPNPSDRWANKFRADKCPNTVISCRGQSNYEEVLLRLASEVIPLKPKCLIDENYVNGFSSTYLSIMIAVCAENGIEYIHTMPTPNTSQPYNWSGDTTHANKNVIINSVRTIRFDEATSVNGDVTQGQDTTKFVSDGGARLHPNTKGSLAMYQRLIDELGL